jgi:hypothetical protein
MVREDIEKKAILIKSCRRQFVSFEHELLHILNGDDPMPKLIELYDEFQPVITSNSVVSFGGLLRILLSIRFMVCATFFAPELTVCTERSLGQLLSARQITRKIAEPEPKKGSDAASLEISPCHFYQF